MATIENFEELKVWQKSRLLCEHIFHIINYPAFAKDFKLKEQINGSSASIMDNIAEGFGRNGNLEFINFLAIAKGSAMETKSQLYRAFDRNYISKEELDKLINLVEEISKMIYSLINYLNKGEFRGTKFKSRAK